MDFDTVVILFFAIVAAILVANSLIRKPVSIWRFIRRGIAGDMSHQKTLREQRYELNS